jgi:hypothetical protein
MRVEIISVAVGLILIAAPSISWADDCDIVNYKDKMSYHKDIMTNLAYVNRIASREDRSKTDNADISVMNYGSFSYGDASRLTSSLESLLDIKWTQHDQEELLTATLTEQGSKDYIACLQSKNMQNFVVTLSDAATSSDEFIVNYAWKPSYAAPNPSIFHSTLLNASSPDAPAKVGTPSSDSFKVKRGSMFKPLELSFHVDHQPYPSITLPAFPTKKLVKQIRTNMQPGSLYGCTSSLVQPVCITLDNNEQDAVIVPNTFKASIKTTIAERGGIVESGARTYNDRQACGRFVWICGAGDAHVAGTVTVDAMVLKAVPVPGAGAQTMEEVGETLMFGPAAAK